MPRDITVTFADGTSHTYQGAPDSVTPDEVQARAEKQFVKTVKSIDGGAKVETGKTGVDAIPTDGYPKAPEAKEPSLIEGLRAAANERMKQHTTPEGIAASPTIKFARSATSPLMALGELLPGKAVQEYVQQQRDLSAKGTEQQSLPDQVLSGTAGIAGDVVGPAGLAATRFIPIAKGAEGLLPKAVQFGKNVAVGTGTGAALNVANPVGNADDLASAKLKQLAEGAEGGALAAGVLTPAIQYGARGAGWLADLVRGRLPTTSAGKVLRDAAGPDIANIKAALGASSPTESAAQSAVSAESPTFSALGARSDEMRSKMALIREQLQKQELEQKLAKIAGGQTQTEAELAAKATLGNLNGITTPMRQTELKAANTAGDLLPKLEGQSVSLGNAAANKVEDVRRFTAAGPRGEAIARSDLINRQLPVGATKYTYLGGDLPTKAEQVAGQAAKDSIILGEGARFAQARADSLAAHGLKPIDTTPVIAKIHSELNNPTIAGLDHADSALSQVAKDIRIWEQKNGGVIDAAALDAIRKNSVETVIKAKMAGQDPSAQARQIAKITASIKPVIDDAIIQAGGTGWKNYLQTHAEGMRLIDQMKLGKEAMRLFQESPDEFVKLVRGNNPDLVRSIFNANNDVASAMGSKYKTLDSVAQSLESKKKLADLASKGNPELNQILTKDAYSINLPGLLNRYVTAGKAALHVGENALNKATMEKVYSGMQNGKSALSLMNELPSSERDKLLRLLRSDKVNIPLVAGAASANN